MNYSTLKKGLALSFAALVGAVTLADAQDAMTSSSSAKVFGGRGQYRTWTLGVNAGVLTPFSNDFQNADINLGYGLSLRKQLGHAFSIEANGFRGKVGGTNEDAPGGFVTVPVGGVQTDIYGFETEINWAADIRGVVNVATVDFLRRENNVNFFLTAGYGVASYAAVRNPAGGGGTEFVYQYGDMGEDDYKMQPYVPIGAGVKFKVSDRVAFNLGYTIHFVDTDDFNGLPDELKNYTKDKFAYGYAGLEFSLGSKAKPDLNWVNPLALMYDELKDPSLRQEVEALKTRVSNIERSIEDLKKDSDGDGVADQFDKCPGTPAGTAVDGSGCPLPKMEAAGVGTNVSGFENIQFEFNSSVLKTEAYPILDQLSSTLRENGGKATLTGYASSEGTTAYNMKLSRDRANSVKTYLVNSGVSSSALTVKAMGEANPVASNDTEEGRIQNRRVETARN